VEGEAGTVGVNPILFCNATLWNDMNKMAPRALEHAALVSGDDDAREAGRAGT
jgi:hypothetical protein